MPAPFHAAVIRRKTWTFRADRLMKGAVLRIVALLSAGRNAVDVNDDFARHGSPHRAARLYVLTLLALNAMIGLIVRVVNFTGAVHVIPMVLAVAEGSVGILGF